MLKEFFLPIRPRLEDMCWIIGLERESGIERVDDSQVGEQLVKLHHPEGIA